MGSHTLTFGFAAERDRKIRATATPTVLSVSAPIPQPVDTGYTWADA